MLHFPCTARVGSVVGVGTACRHGLGNYIGWSFTQKMTDNNNMAGKNVQQITKGLQEAWHLKYAINVM